MFKTNWTNGDAGHISEHNNLGKDSNSRYNVMVYGATGNGVTDDTAAIAAAIAAIPATGGILFFPPGVYITSGGFTIANPITVQGCGMVGHDGITSPTSKITCTSSSISLFTVTSYTARFRDIALVNTYVGTPTDGAGITVAYLGAGAKVDYSNISITGFYINVDSQVGEYWIMNNCMLFSPVKYALKIRNTYNVDAGDWSLSNSLFKSQTYSVDALIRIESSGGGKINNCKFDSASTPTYTYGIDLVPASGSDTIILHVMNSSIENFCGNGINAVVNGTAKWRSVVITGCEFGAWGSCSPGHGISLSADTINNLRCVSIVGNTFMGASTASAIDLIKIDNAQIFANTIQTFTPLLTQSECTNVVVQAA